MSVHWALIGDSQAVGLTAPLRAIATAAGATLHARAQVGWTTRATLSDAEVRTLAAARPDLVMVVLGGNDSPSAELAERIADLRALFAGSRLIWVGPAHVTLDHTDLAARKDAVARIQASVASAQNFEWYDGRTMTRDLEHQPDGVHFRPSALSTWAQRIRARLDSSPGITKLVIGSSVALGALALFAWWRLR